MIAVAIRFLTGRFHATPWGYQVNEGEVEWPPAPWRLLRALRAVWFHHEQKRTSVEDLFGLLDHLAPPPLFRLPDARTAHTRHYMPWRKGGKPDTTLVLDTFVVPGREKEVQAIWPEADPSLEQRELLARLLRHVGYLGRAESWAELRLIEAPSEPNVRPLADLEAPREDEIETRLLASQGIPRWESLELDTLDMRRAGRAIPAGARWQRYARPADLLHPRSRRVRTRSSTIPGPALARYAVHAPARTPVHYTLFFGEDIRRALMSRVEGRSAIFSGREAGAPRLDGNRHAFFLPEDADGDGRIDHLTVYSPEGFGVAERRALEGFRVLLRRGKGYDQLLLLELLCAIDEMDPLGLSCAGIAATWISATPFCLLRHPKANGKDGPIAQVKLELARRGYPTPTGVEILPRPVRSRSLEWRHFRRRRASQPPRVDLRTYPCAWGFRLEFPEAVRGPIALGYACHFGLGRFVPLEGE